MKYIMPIFVISASIYAVYRLIKSGQEEPPEERFMVVDDPYSDAEYYVPDFGPGGEP
jgi:hypothetical protein